MSKPKPGITKVFLAGHDWPGLVSDVHGQLSTLVEKRLGYKLAASPLFSKKDLDDHQPEKGWFMRHQVVKGDQEKYGFNIYADGYPADTIEKYHPTFVTTGHVFREHNNQDPRKAIGKITAVRYSRKLGRVETLEHLEIKKAEALPGQHCAHPLMQRYGVGATTRASLAFYNTEAEVDRFLAALAKVRAML